MTDEDSLEHIWPGVDGAPGPSSGERAHGHRFCRRCGRLLWSEKYGDHDPPPCATVRITFRSRAVEAS